MIYSWVAYPVAFTVGMFGGWILHKIIFHFEEKKRRAVIAQADADWEAEKQRLGVEARARLAQFRA